MRIRNDEDTSRRILRRAVALATTALALGTAACGSSGDGEHAAVPAEGGQRWNTMTWDSGRWSSSRSAPESRVV